MPYYIRSDPRLSSPQTWLITDREAVNVAAVNPKGIPGHHYCAKEGEDIWNAIRRQASDWLAPEGHAPFVATDLQMGECFPRLARPRDDYPDEPFGVCPQSPADISALAVSVGQLGALLDMLDRICRTVQPEGANLNAYGHEIRNALLLASMEVETQWRGVLQSNGVRKDRYNTRDYVQLAPAMRLSEYVVGFPAFPWLKPAAPFEGWGLGDSPTKALPWYEAHHSVKHDRENSFQRGTLNHLFAAIAGCIVMLGAQFGDYRGFMEADLMRRFQVSAWPRWPVAACYITPRSPYADGWKPKNYPFAPQVRQKD